MIEELEGMENPWGKKEPKPKKRAAKRKRKGGSDPEFAPKPKKEPVKKVATKRYYPTREEQKMLKAEYVEPKKSGRGSGLKPARPGEVRNPGGVPKRGSLIRHTNFLLKQEGYEEVTNIDMQGVLKIMLNLPESKVKTISQDDSFPLLYKLVAKELTGKRGGDYLEKILDRAFGKATQTAELTVHTEQALFPETAPEPKAIEEHHEYEYAEFEEGEPLLAQELEEDTDIEEENYEDE